MSLINKIWHTLIWRIFWKMVEYNLNCIFSEELSWLLCFDEFFFMNLRCANINQSYSNWKIENAYQKELNSFFRQINMCHICLKLNKKTKTYLMFADWHSHIWWKRVLQPPVLHLLPDTQPLSCGNSNRICLWRPHRWWSAFTSYPRNSFLYILWLERCH